MSAPKFKITYSTLSADNPELHAAFDAAVVAAKAGFGQTFSLLIGGEERRAAETFRNTSPIDTNLLLGYFQKGSRQDGLDAIAAARAAFPAWARVPWAERLTILRRAADLMDERTFEIAAIMSIEIGKNRLEALGDIAETADLVRYYCDDLENNDGYKRQLLSETPKHRNYSLLKPYGVWCVISPFNFPAALAGGPTGAALVAGNTVVLKPATDTPYTAWKLVECFRDAGLPDGVLNYVTGPGRTIGEALTTSMDIDGYTFTGSYDVGMHLLRTVAQGPYPRPVVAEMGGKNPVIVSRRAQVDDAAYGVMRAAFGLQGQKCSAASRVYVERPVYDDFLHGLLKHTESIVIGDPTRAEVFMGPVANRSAYEDYQRYCSDLAASGEILFGGRVLTDGDYGKGYFATPTIVSDLPLDHALWKTEMFLPIVAVHAIDSLEEGMRLANDHTYGLTAGFYGDPDETQWFFDHIEIGVSYANRRSSATTGAWPGYQAFGGWKGSGTTGKAAGSFYYLPFYLREQSQTLVIP